MKTLNLDLSTCTGWSILEDGVLIKGLGRIEIKPKNDVLYPRNYIECAREISHIINKKAFEFTPNIVVIEETNQLSRGRHSQKLLEFIHFAVADMLLSSGFKLVYMSTSQWHKIVGLKLTKEEREKNKVIKESRDKAKQEMKQRLEVDISNKYYYELDNAVDAAEARQIRKKMKEELKARMKSYAATLRVKSNGVVIGKVTNKHLSIHKANELFKLNLQMKDNDLADSLLLGRAYWQGYYNKNMKGNE